MSVNATYRPTLAQLDAELKRLARKRGRRKWLLALVIMLVLALLVGMYTSFTYFSLLRTDGGSMKNTLVDGDVVISRKEADIRHGDVISFDRGGTLLIKRVIALAGDQINIAFDGTVSINGVALSEDYVTDKALGINDMSYPFTVPSGKLFVMGDHRVSSVDSRSNSVGLVSVSEVIGRVEALVWPLSRITLMR